MTTTTSETEGLYTPGRVREDEPGEATVPESILKSANAARMVYERFRAGHLNRIALYQEIKGLLQGSPPYDPELLRSAGLHHVANFNDMSACAVVERACLAYWNLLHNSETIINFIIRSKQKDPQLPYFAKLMSKHWDFAVKKYWKGFTVNLATLGSQLVELGVSPLIFPDEDEVKWRVVNLNRFFIPDQSSSELEELNICFVETDFTLQYLYGVYKEFKESDPKNNPWQIPQLVKLLVTASGSYGNGAATTQDSYEIEKGILAGDVDFSSSFDTKVKIISVFQKEYTGKITHAMFHRDVTGNLTQLQSTAGQPAGKETFLYFEQEQYEDIFESLVIFTMNPGQAEIHANRGIGHKIFSLAQAKIQLDCSVVDMAKWASTPIIKSSSLGSKDADMIRFYPGVATNIGSTELQQNNLGANVDNVVGAAQYLSNLIQFNISYSGSDVGSPDPDTGSITPSQVRLQAFKEFSVLKNCIQHYYSTFDLVLQNMATRIFNHKPGTTAADIFDCWKERCVDDGVPEELFTAPDDRDKRHLPKHLEVSATRAAGSGSQVAMIIALEMMKEFAGGFGAKEEKEFKRLFYSTVIGSEYVPTFLQEGDDVDEVAGGASLAACENAIMQAGKSPVFSADNDQRSHIAVHTALGTETVKAIQQQQMEVVEADSIFNVLIPHLQQHIGAAQKSIFMQSFLQTALPAFKQLERYALLNRQKAAKVLQSRIRQESEDQQGQERAMTEDELKQHTTMREEERKDMKLAAQSERQERAGAAKEQALDRKVTGELAIKAKKAAGEVANQKIKQQLDNNSNELAEQNPGEYLDGINGQTPAPYDIEKQ